MTNIIPTQTKGSPPKLNGLSLRHITPNPRTPTEKIPGNATLKAVDGVVCIHTDIGVSLPYFPYFSPLFYYPV